jgi:hypothetical protein
MNSAYSRHEQALKARQKSSFLEREKAKTP